MSEGYSCSACGAAATVRDGVLVRTCDHSVAVLAHMSGTAYGQSSLANGNAFERALHHLLRLAGLKR